MTPTDQLLIIGMLACFCAFFATYSYKKDHFIDKIKTIVSELDVEKGAPILIDLIKSEEVQEFLYSAMMNAINNKAHVLNPYIEDFYKTLKNKIFSNTGHAGKDRKRAAVTICEMTLSKHPLGKAALTFFGDDIKDMIAEDPEQALQIANLLISNMKGQGAQTAVDKGDIGTLSPLLSMIQQQV